MHFSTGKAFLALAALAATAAASDGPSVWVEVTNIFGQKIQGPLSISRGWTALDENYSTLNVLKLPPNRYITLASRETEEYESEHQIGATIKGEGQTSLPNHAAGFFVVDRAALTIL